MVSTRGTEPAADVATIPTALDYLEKTIDELVDPLRSTLQYLGLPDLTPTPELPKAMGTRLELSIGRILRMREAVQEYKRLLYTISSEVQKC